MNKVTLAISESEKAEILLSLLRRLDFVDIIDIDEKLAALEPSNAQEVKSKISAITLQYFLSEMTQERVYVDSSMLSWVAYDAEEEVLTVEFVNNGEIWAYYEIPQEIYDELLEAPSVGRFMRANVLGTFPEALVG